MLKIKLARFGKKGQPHYRIIVNEAKSKRDGEYVAKLGEYAPTFNPKILKLDLTAYAEWLAKGAQPTKTVANLAKRAASKNPFPAKKIRVSKKVQAKKLEKASAKTVEPTPKVTPTDDQPEVQSETQPASQLDAPSETVLPESEDKE